MRALVTGSNGFIGSHLVERLLGDGHSVVALDLEKPKKTPGIQNIKVDLAKDKKIEKYFTEFYWVFHLAGRSDIVPSITDPASYHDVNVSGTVNVLEASRRAGVKRFIYSASSSCYGSDPPLPTAETAPINFRYPYAFTKYIGEQYALHWARVYKIPVLSLRLFNVYGPRVRVSKDYGPVLSTFLPQKLAGLPFTVVGDGRQRRDFVYVSDVTAAFIAAARSKFSGEVFNVGSGVTHTINELVRLLGGGKVVHIPKRPGEPNSTWADITKIKRMLLWRPRISFAQGIGYVLRDSGHWKEARVWTAKTIKRATADWFRYVD